MKKRAEEIVERLHRRHREDVIRCFDAAVGEDGTPTPVRLRMWKDLAEMRVVEMPSGKALEGWVLTDIGRIVASEVVKTRYSLESFPISAQEPVKPEVATCEAVQPKPAKRQPKLVQAVHGLFSKV